MSHQAVAWALQQPVKPSPAKFILVALAHNVRASDATPWRAFASVGALVDATGQNRKTVMVNIDRLIQDGWLHDTGERTGNTKSVPIYELCEAESSTKIGTSKQSQIYPEAVPETALHSSTENGTASTPSDPKSGTASTGEAVPDLPGSGTRFTAKQSQIYPEAVPDLGHHRDIKGKEEKQEEKNKPPAHAARESEPGTSSLTAADLQAEGVAPDVAAEFVALRKRKRAALTALALAGIQREADIVGWTLDQALRRCVERGWQGFDASWVQNRPAAGAPRMSRQEIAEAEHQRFLELIGNEPPDDGRTVDMGEHHASH